MNCFQGYYVFGHLCGKRRSIVAQAVLLTILLIVCSGNAFAAEMVSNGNFNTSNNWTLATATYDSGSTNTADSSGSVTVSASGRNTAATGTATQTLSIATGSIITAATDVVAAVQHSSTTVASAQRSLTIELEYQDTTTVEIFFNDTFTDGTAWAGVSNQTATGFPLNLTQDVVNVIVTLYTKDGNNASAASQLWVDDISILYTPAAGNSAPNVPTNLVQYKSDGSTVIASGGTTDETSVVIEADISDPDGGDTVKLQVDIDGDNASDFESTLAVTPQTNVQVTVTGLVDTQSYDWQVRTVDNSGAASAWTPYAGSPDFIVSLPACTPAAPTLTVSSNKNVKSAESVVYTISVKNNDNALCAVTDYQVSINSETDVNNAFDPSSLTPVSPATISVVPGATDNTITLTVTGNGTGVDGNLVDVEILLVDPAPAPAEHTNQTVTSRTTIANFNPMIHSSLSTSSNKHGGDWGTATGKYGEFTCATCHERGATNIKRIRTTIIAPNGTDEFPIQADLTPPAGVVFLDTNDGTSAFGDDSRADQSQSTNICEVCHTYDASQTVGVNVHGYTMPSDPGHDNANDCVTCHKHSNGFDAACDTCHGNPPTTNDTSTTGLVFDPNPTGATDPVSAGGHQAHAVTMGMACITCHKGNTMPTVSNTIQMGFEVNNANWSGFGDTATTGTLDAPNSPGFMSASYSFVSSSAGTIIAGVDNNNLTCSVYCHGDWAGNGGQTATSWVGGTTMADDCNDCHGGAAATPPTTGSHQTHAGNTAGDLALACSKCHPSYSDTAHLDGDVAWALDTADSKITLSATYDPVGAVVAADSGTTGAKAPSAAYGTCAGLYCHSQGEGSAPIDTPLWGDATTGACGDCHAIAPGTNAHPEHYSAKGWTADGSNCGTCHDETAGNHVNGTPDILAGLSYASSSCGTTPAGCHNGNSTPVWDTGTAISCSDCHSVGGSNSATVANPVSGLHVNTTAAVQDHDSTLGTSGCEECHVKTSINNHWDGTASATVDYTKAAVGITSAMYTDAGGTGATRGSCFSASPGTDLDGCHSDSGEWRRLWSTDADFDISASPLPGQAGCNVCHGQYSTLTASTGWNEGTVHYRSGSGATENKGIIHTDAGDECEDCHGYNSAANHNSNNAIDFSDISAGGGTYDIVLNTDRWYCATCHNTKMDEDPALTTTHTFVDSLAFPNSIAHVTGTSAPEGDCFGCHGDGIAEYWPQNAGNDRDLSTDASYNNVGQHDVHMGVLAIRLGYTLPGTDAQQRAMCVYCHVVEDGDHMTKGVGEDAEVFNSAKSLWDANDADASYSEPNDTCSNVDCHNSQLTVDGTYGWYDAGTSTCTMCHTPGGSNIDPNSGLHTGATPTISTQKHDDSITGGCAACHTSLPANSTSSSHINGTASTNGSVAGDRTSMGLFGTYSNGGSDNVGTCATNCHSGAGDSGTWARRWDSSVHYDPADGDFVECAGCHGGFSNDWTFGFTADTGDGSVEHDRNWDGDGNTGEVIGNHPDSTDKCKSCHGFGYAGVYDEATFGAHRDGKITFNDEMGYNPTTFTCATYCHSDNTNHNLEDSGWSTTANTVDAPPLACTDCHAGVQASAGVNVDSPHSTNTIFTSKGVAYTCEDCHTGHGLGDEQVPNNAAVGISFGTGGIDLSDPVGTATTEANICWNCHNAHGVSEWDTNTDTNTASFPNFNFGSLNQLGWNGATWSSANFIYKQGTIQSTHSVNSTSGVSGVDADGNIRCSYCHDVHDTNKASGDTMTGKPYLRGTWVGNPYLEDGAPRNDGNSDDADYSAHDVTASFGAVPRGATNYTSRGGYYIDQNSGNPTANAAMDSPDEFAGLCRLCHEGTSGIPGDNIWQAAEIDDINKFGTSSVDWVGTNGHSAVVKGGGSSHAANIFTMADRLAGSLLWTGNAEGSGRAAMAYVNARFVDKGAFTDSEGQGFRGVDSNSYQYTPRVDTGARKYNYRNYNWGATVTVEAGTLMNDSGIDANYHQFTCSKCHNPHASRLPRLMITNCLDTNHNTWDDSFTTPASDTNGDGGALVAENTSTTMSQVTSAQNCHRRNDSQDTESKGSGWNNVTPWVEF